MQIEPRLECLAPVTVLTPSWQRDWANAFSPGLPQPASDFVSREIGHADVEQRGVRMK